MFTEIFGDSPRVKLLDFFANHVDYDYTISQLEEFTGISRPTIYQLIDELEAEKMLALTREVGASRFFRLNAQNEKVIAMLQLDIDAINKSLLEQVSPSGRAASAGHAGLAPRRVVVGQPRYAAQATPRGFAAGAMKAKKGTKRHRG